MMNILDMHIDATSAEETIESSTLNPKAQVFVPGASTTIASSSTNATLLPHSESPHFANGWETGYYQAAEYYGAEYYGAAYQGGSVDYRMWATADSSVDDSVGYWVDQEEVLARNLYRPPNQPRGNTAGRSRRQPRWPRA